MRLEELERELRAERPEVDPDFATRLDEWADRGFPRDGELDPRRERRRGPLGFRKRRHGTALGRTLVPVAVVAAFAIVIAGVALTDFDAGEDHSDTDDAPVAEVEMRPQGGAELGQGAAPTEDAATEEFRPAGPAPGAGRASDAGPNQRRVAQTVSVSLATAPEDFRGAADGVLDVVADHNGFVMSSNVTGGDPGVEGADAGRARFELRIPAAQLQPALAALSDLGHLVSRSDGTRDITARFESARERIETFGEARDRLLERLEEAETESEQESIRRRLRIVENRLERAREDLARAQQRVRQVPVNVTIAADESISDSAGWGIGDAFADARDILRVAAGVALISLAILVPLALLALLILLASRLLARAQRDRALDRS